MIEEVEIGRIKRLERLTVNWFEQSVEVINVIFYNGEYYCIDDPILLEDKDKVKIRIIAEVSNEKKLYEEYLRNIVRAPLNPYAIFLLYQRNIAGIPKEYLLFIEKNKKIPLFIIERLNAQLMHFKCITTIEPAILNTITRLLEEANKYDISTERLCEEILIFIETWVESSNYAYPDAETLYSTIMTVILEDYKKRKMDVEEERRGSRDININIVDQKQALTIPIIASATSISSESKADDNSFRRDERANMLERTIAFKITYPSDKEGFVDRLVNKITKIVERIFKKFGIIVQTA